MKVCKKTTTSTTPSTSHSAKMTSQRRIGTAEAISNQPAAHQQNVVRISSKHVLLLIALSSCLLAYVVGHAPLPMSPTRYSEWEKNVSYSSSLEHKSYGMQPLYNFTHMFVWALVGDDPIPEGYFIVEGGEVHLGPKSVKNDWFDLVKHYWAICLIALIALVLVGLMPIIGLCFCCCRCAGKCGGRSEPFDKKCDPCRRVCYGFFLIILCTGILLGLIAAFATNSLMENGLTGSTSSVRTGSSDMRKFFDYTSDQINHYLIVNYKELQHNVLITVQNCAVAIMERVEHTAKLSQYDALRSFLSQLPATKIKLERMKNLTNELRIDASQLHDGLRGVKRNLLVSLTKCQEKPICKEIMEKYQIAVLERSFLFFADHTDDKYFPKLPDVTETIEKLDGLLTNDVKIAITSITGPGRLALDRMERYFNDSFSQYMDPMMRVLEETSMQFRQLKTEFEVELSRVQKLVENRTEKYAELADDFLDEYSPYRFYAGIAICLALLLILSCLVCGLCCGICGKRPDGYGGDCCNKGAGSRFLMIAVGLIFFTISVIILIAMVHFLLGIVVYRGVCRSFSDPENDLIFSKLDKSVDLNKILFPSTGIARSRVPRDQLSEPFRMSELIGACQRNETVYKVLHINNTFDIHKIKQAPFFFGLNRTLEDFKRNIALTNETIQLLTDAEKSRLIDGKPVFEHFNAGAFVDNLNETMTRQSLLDLATKCREAAYSVELANDKETQVVLRNQALHLETYEENLLKPLTKNAQELMDLASEMDESLRFYKIPFGEAIYQIQLDIAEMERFINVEGKKYVKGLSRLLADFISKEVDRYLNRVVDAVQHKIGVCSPLARVYDSGVITGCNHIADPLNGFWASIFWCILLLFPALVVAIKLASLYQKSDPYPGPLVEAEYLYDAYSERDHIPLANGPKNKRRKNKDRRRREYYEDAVGSTTSHGVVVPAATADGGVRDTRYSDMAPKHWDGGPPRYQNPPMAPPASEYERPPPYYYPGATED